MQWITDGHRTFKTTSIREVFFNARCNQCALGKASNYIVRVTTGSGFIFFDDFWSIAHTRANTVDKSKSHRVNQIVNRILLDNANCTLDQFNQTNIFAFFCQRWQPHSGRVCLIIECQDVDSVHSSWMTLLYLVKQRSKVGTFVTVRRFGVLRIELRAEILAVFFVLVRSPRGEHHGNWTGLFQRRCVSWRRCGYPGKNKTRYDAKYTPPANSSHRLKLRQQNVLSNLAARFLKAPKHKTNLCITFAQQDKRNRH